MMSPSIRAIIFDFGNVIGFFDHRLGAARVARLLGESITEDDVYHFYYGTDLEDQHERGLISSAEVIERFKAHFRSPQASDEELARAFGDIFSPNPAVIEVVRRLPPSLRLVLGSNTNELHYRWFAPMFRDVFDRFAHLVLSFEVGCRKPEASFYRHCLRACDCSPSEAVFVDDRPDNVEGAQALGIRGLCYNPKQNLANWLEHEAGIALHRLV